MAINKINSNMIGAGDVSNAEHAYLNSVTSNIQTQISNATYDDTVIRADILNLALGQAVSDNRIAFNLENAFVDGFEDDSGITTETNVDRDATGEFVYTGTTAIGAFSSDANTLLLLHMDDTGLTDSSSHGHTMHLNADVARSSTQSKYGGYSAVYDGQSDQIRPADDSMWDFGTGDYTIETWIWINSLVNNGAIYDTGAWGSNNFDLVIRYNANGTWELGLYNGSSDRYLRDATSPSLAINTWYHLCVERESGTTRLYRGGNLISATVVSGFVGNENITSSQPRIGANTWTSHNGYLDEMRISNIARYKGNNFTPNEVISLNATGTLISDPQTASSSRTSCSGAIVYEDASGTATLGTDLKIYFTANNGSNWTEAASYATATTYAGSKKLVKLGATTVTGGTQIALKAVWANQSNGSKETRLHGWAVNY